MTDRTPTGYADALAEAKRAIRSARVRAVLTVDRELVELYWTLGRLILDRQERDGWGSKVVERLASDLRREFPGMTGLSVRNLLYMRSFAAAWPDAAIVQQLVALLPWGHNLQLLAKLDDPELRRWYAAEAIAYGWSRAVLENQIMSQLHLRAGSAPSNLAELLSAGDSELMQQVTKDPCNLAFLMLERDVAERDLEAALVTHIQEFLLELGTGFAFVGRQHRLEVAGDEFFIDLLMFHIPSARLLCTNGGQAAGIRAQRARRFEIGQARCKPWTCSARMRSSSSAPISSASEFVGAAGSKIAQFSRSSPYFDR
ncbi:MAG: PDDEXK nuclease domain-containing protein [Ilumatobacteraceae bacterium]